MAELGDVVRQARTTLPLLRAKTSAESVGSSWEEPAAQLEKVEVDLKRLLSVLPSKPPDIDLDLLKSPGAVPKADGYVTWEEALRELDIAEPN